MKCDRCGSTVISTMTTLGIPPKTVHAHCVQCSKVLDHLIPKDDKQETAKFIRTAMGEESVERHYVEMCIRARNIPDATIKLGWLLLDKGVINKEEFCDVMGLYKDDIE